MENRKSWFQFEKIIGSGLRRGPWAETKEEIVLEFTSKNGTFRHSVVMEKDEKMPEEAGWGADGEMLRERTERHLLAICGPWQSQDPHFPPFSRQQFPWSLSLMKLAPHSHILLSAALENRVPKILTPSAVTVTHWSQEVSPWTRPAKQGCLMLYRTEVSCSPPPLLLRPLQALVFIITEAGLDVFPPVF